MTTERAFPGARPKMLPRAAFIHVPKAAGSTLIYALRRIYGRDHVWVRDGRGWPMDVPDGAPRSPRVWAGHMGYGLHDVLGLDVTYLSVLRHPSPRLSSAYRYIKTRPRNPWHEQVNAMTLDEFTTGRPIAPEFDNGQVRRLLPDGEGIPLGGCTEDHVHEVLKRCEQGHILLGVQELFDPSLLHFARCLGWPSPYYWTQNSVGPARGRSVDVDATSDYSRLDLLLYNEARSRLEQLSREDDALGPAAVRRFRQRNYWGYRTVATPLMAYRKARISLRRRKT